MRVSVDFKRHRSFNRRVAVAVASTLIMAINVPILTWIYGINSHFIMISSSVYHLLHNSFYTSQFSCAALAVGSRFKILNEYLAGYMFEGLVVVQPLIDYHCRFQPQPVKQPKKIQAAVKIQNFNMRLFSELYNDLCDTVELVNNTFTFQLIIVMMSILLIDIFAAYGALREFMSNSNERLKFLIIANSTWIAIQYLMKVFMACSGSRTTSEATKSLVHLTRLIEATESSNPMKLEMNFLLIQMKCRNKNFQNVFFNINWHLILAVILVLTIYSCLL